MASGIFLGVNFDPVNDNGYFRSAALSALSRDPRVLDLQMTSDSLALMPPYFKNLTPLDHRIIGSLDIIPEDTLDAKVNFIVLSTPLSFEIKKMTTKKLRTLEYFLRKSCVFVLDTLIAGRIRTTLGLTPQHWTAPALATERFVDKEKKSIVIYVNDSDIGDRFTGDIISTINNAFNNVDIIVQHNGLYKHDGSAAWLERRVRGALCHLHVGIPFFDRPHGRLIDSAGCQVPVVLFVDDPMKMDQLRQSPNSPSLVDEIHFLHASTIQKLGLVLREITHDVALRAQLINNCSVVCREFNSRCSDSIVSSLVSC